MENSGGGGTGFSGGAGPAAPASVQSPGGGGGFPPLAGLKSRPPREWGLRKVDFCQSSACWEPSCCELEGLETWGVTGQVGFFPHSTLHPQFTCWGVCARACMLACLLLGFLYLFVILGRGWLGWPAGSGEGLSCWGFQIELVSGWAQLLRDCHIPC